MLAKLAHSFPCLARERGVTAQHAPELTPRLHDAALRVSRGSPKNHWPRWARAGWPKEENVSNLLLLLLGGEETLLPNTENCHCTLWAVIA